MLDICVNFRTIYMNEKGIEETNPYIIARNYIKGVFILDILATVPFDDLLKISKSYQEYIDRVKENKES